MWSFLIDFNHNIFGQKMLIISSVKSHRVTGTNLIAEQKVILKWLRAGTHTAFQQNIEVESTIKVFHCCLQRKRIH